MSKIKSYHRTGFISLTGGNVYDGSAMVTIKATDKMYVSGAWYEFGAVDYLVSWLGTDSVVSSAASVASGIGLSSNGWASVLPGGTLKNTSVTAASAAVAGVIADCEIFGGAASAGSCVVSGCGIAEFCTVRDGGEIHLQSNARASNCTVGGGGYLFCSRYSLANSCTVDSGGVMMAVNYAKVIHATVHSGGSADIALATIGSSVIGGDVHVSSGGLISDSEIVAGGVVGVVSAGILSSTVHSGGILDLWGVYVGANCHDVVVSGGVLRIYYDGRMSNCDLTGGPSADAVASVTNMGALNVRNMNQYAILNVSSGGTATLLFNPWGGTVNSATGATVTYYGRDQNVYYGSPERGIASKGNACSDLVLGSGESALVFPSGTVTRTAVESGGVMLMSGGYAAETRVSSGGVMQVSSGGTAFLTIAESSGSLTVSSGGTAHFIVSSAGAAVSILEGGTSLGTVLTSGAAVSGEQYDVLIYSGAAMSLTSAGESTQGNLHIWSGGLLTVGEFGWTHYCTVYSGGAVTVTSAGRFDESNLFGTLDVAFGGSAFNVSGTGSMTAQNGGCLDYPSVSGGGVIDIEPGGTANTPVAGNGGTIRIFGSAGYATAGSGGHVVILPGGSAGPAMIGSGGTMTVSSGGTASEVMRIDGQVIIAEDGATVTYLEQ